jgi:glutamate N-acetyltransferase/amino-acid N-acetyltransferase
MNVLEGSFGNIDGFASLGKSIGMKQNGKDLAILYSDSVCETAAIYTQNAIKGAPLHVTKDHLTDGKAQAIVVNSRIANVATGEQGILNAQETTRLVASELGIDENNILVASTGVIGLQLPMDKIRSGVQGIKQELMPDGDFAEAIMTTDTVKKEIAIEHKGFKIAGAAKGVGMIQPNMATMLAFIVTDAEIPPEQLQKSLQTSADKTFNMMSVDTDTSTSDMAILMSNGRIQNVDLDAFQEALDFICLELTKKLASDGEGATKLIICNVKGAQTEADAKKAAKSIINSPLVKTAVYGNDPNWGRLMMAIGKSGASNIQESKIAIQINQNPIVQNGIAAPDYEEAKLTEIMKSNYEIIIDVDLATGEGMATAYGCDMSEEYIKINAEYTT